jgi:hypothetical protein
MLKPPVKARHGGTGPSPAASCWFFVRRVRESSRHADDQRPGHYAVARCHRSKHRNFFLDVAIHQASLERSCLLSLAEQPAQG